VIRLVAALCLLLVADAAPAIDTEVDFPDPALQTRYEALIHELRCVQCQNNTIADSPSGVAADLRHQVHNMVQEGKTEAEILDFLTARYGDFVLYRPPFAPRTWLLWLAPALLLGIGGLVAYRIITRRSRLVDEDPDEPEDSGAGAR
jgi:cytochrome c-type biogenesis protein CcmH